MDIVLIYVMALCILMVIILPFVVKEIWESAEGQKENFFVWLLILYGAMCALLPILMLGDWTRCFFMGGC
tara:strand:+ start:220 stop:429 length:210 start_codon:yes stop_codon:yes gene_type:complete